MSRQLSVGSILAELQARMEHHQNREAFHAQQEAFHQQQRAHHAAELQTARERFEAFQAAADAAGELVARPKEEKAPHGPGRKDPPRPRRPGVLRNPVYEEQGRGVGFWM